MERTSFVGAVAFVSLVATWYSGMVTLIIPNDTRTALQSRRFITRGSQFASLPIELFVNIFDNVCDIVDALFLCLTHPTLATLGARRLDELILERMGPWAGKHVLCLRGHVHDEDFPASVQALARRQLRQAQVAHSQTASATDVVPPFVQIVQDTYTWAEPPSVPYRLDSFVYALGFTGLDPAEDAAVKAFTEAMKQALYTERPKKSGRILSLWDDENSMAESLASGPAADEVWCLCNLSKGKYVRDLGRTCTVEGSTIPLGFGQILLTHTCWGIYTNQALHHLCAGCRPSIFRGDWAGDCFEITTLGNMTDGIEWEDVTEEVMDELEGITRCRCDLWFAVHNGPSIDS